MKNRLFVLISLVVFSAPMVQGNTPDMMLDYILKEQQRIDLIDGAQDDQVTLKSAIQSKLATEVYVEMVNAIVSIVSISTVSDVLKVAQLDRVLYVLRQVSPQNVHFFSNAKGVFELILKVQKGESKQKTIASLKSNVKSALNLIPFYINENYTEKFLIDAAYTEPTELLRHYDEFYFKQWSKNVLIKTVEVAPIKVQTYMYTYNGVSNDVRSSTDPVVQAFARIAKDLGTTSRAFILLDEVYRQTLTPTKAHEICKYDSVLLPRLLELRMKQDILGIHSVDESLQNLSLKKIREINELHNEPNNVRYASVAELSAEELYILMTYSEEEIFTSTFLELYTRLMKKMDASSTFEFLHGVGFVKFRTFIKMCAGYNTLSSFLAKMTPYEREKLFRLLVENLEKLNDNLASAVAIADTYSSLSRLEDKLAMENALKEYRLEIKYTDPLGADFYAVILNVLGIEQGDVAIKNSGVMDISNLLKNGKNIQQHFFFDDPDGQASYVTFLQTFDRPGWATKQYDSYTKIYSTAGNSIEMYANKPEAEYKGQADIEEIFSSSGRWPDIVVHRGHSYFANTAIESITPNAEIVFLGSCGGYNAVNQVLHYSPNAQIIASKQIGTMAVNNALLLKMNEALRKGESLAWDELWRQINASIKGDATAISRFRDYIPPHKNLGAALIKAYQGIL